MLSDWLSACCFMEVSGFGLGGLSIALVFVIFTGIGALSSRYLLPRSSVL